MMRSSLLFSITVKGCSLVVGCRNRKTTVAVDAAKRKKINVQLIVMHRLFLPGPVTPEQMRLLLGNGASYIMGRSHAARISA